MIALVCVVAVTAIVFVAFERERRRVRRVWRDEVNAEIRIALEQIFTLRDAFAALGPATRKAGEAMAKLAEATAGAGGARRW